MSRAKSKATHAAEQPQQQQEQNGRLRLEYLPANQINANPDNWRFHPPEQVSAMTGAMRKVGWAGALLYNERTGKLLDGHMRRALAADGELVPVLIGSWSEEQERLILLTHDPLGAMAESSRSHFDALMQQMNIESDGVGALLTQLSQNIRDPFRVVHVPIDELHDHPRNYREHPDSQLDHIIASITEHGYFRNIIVANDGTILAGHGVVKASRKMGKQSVPVIKLDIGPDDPRALAVMAGDNEIGRLAITDDLKLAEMLKEIMAANDGSLVGTGFTEHSLEILEGDFKRIGNQEEEWKGLPEYQSDDCTPWKQLIVSFRNAEDYEAFQELVGQKLTAKTKSIWHPFMPKAIYADKRIVGDEE